MKEQDAAEQPEYRRYLYDLFIQPVPDFAIFLLGPDESVLTWSPAAKRVMGYGGHEILGQPLATLYPPDAVDRQVPHRELEQARTEGRASDDTWLIRKGGQRIWVKGVTDRPQG